MAIDKKIPRYLNQDSDYILSEVSEMTDARNIRVSSDEDGNGGVIKNVKGNTSVQLSQALPIGNNRVVGVCENDSENELYFFVWNSNENHTIWKLSPRVSSQATLVLQSDALDFYPSSQLQSNVVLVGDSVYLYFTDGFSEPKKVNVKQAENGNYPAGSTKQERSKELFVSKQYPKEITALFSTDNSVRTNNLYGKGFQFCAQYVYRDGEYSALGRYSELFVSVPTLDNTNRTESIKHIDNKLSLSLEISVPEDSLEHINFYVRENASGTFYYIGEVQKNEFSNGFAFIDFYNDGNYPAIADSEFNKLEDSVPRIAQAQTVAGNRLMYANYLEGFDFNNKPTATISPFYNNIPTTNELDLGIEKNDVSERIVSYWDLSNVPTGPSVKNVNVTGNSILGSDGYIYYRHDVAKSVSLTTPYNTFTDTNATIKFGLGEYEDIFSYEIVAPTGLADAASKLISVYPNEITIPVDTRNSLQRTVLTNLTDGRSWGVYYIGNIVLEAVSQTYIANNPDTIFNGKPVIKFIWKVKEFNIEASRAMLISGSGPVGAFFSNISSTYSFTNTNDDAFTVSDIDGTNGLRYSSKSLLYKEIVSAKSFKSYDSHSFGVVYYDKTGRASGVKPLGSLDLYGLNSPDRNGNNGNTEVDIQLTSPIPNWATHFSFAYDFGRKYNAYTQYSIIEGMTSDDVNTNLSAANTIYLSIRGLQGKEQSYVEGDSAKIKYNFSEGDRVRVLKYRTNVDEYAYPTNIEFEVIGFVTYDDPVTSPLVPRGGGNTDEINFRKTGDFIKVKEINYGGWTITDIKNNVDFFSKNVIVEVYSPKSSLTTESVYYEVGGLHPISQHSQVFRITDGNCWYVERNIKHLPWVNPDGDKTSKDLVDVVEYVESNRFSDFIDLEATSKGKPRGVIENEKEISRYASITYSEPYVQDSSRLWLSSFNNSLANWMDYDVMNGGIYGLVNMDQSIMMLQEDKVSIIPLNKQIITTATNNTLVGLSTDFLGNAQYYEGKFGINKNRGAFVLAEGDVYIFDVQRGSVYQLGAKGVARISSFGMSSYFEKIGTELTEFETQQIGGSLPNLGGRNLYKINVGHDRQNSEIVISFVKGVEDLYALIGESYLGITWDYSEPAIAFDYSESKWASFRDINSDAYANMGNLFYHLKNVSGNFIWLSESNNTYCKFFNTQKSAFFETVFNTAKFNRKVYHALSIDGDSSADVTISTKTQTATLPKAAFQLKEDEYFSSLPRVNGNNEYVALGIVSSKNGNQITFGNRINRMPFRLGGEIFAFSGGSYATKSAIIQSVVSANTILVSNGTNINIGDSLVIKGDSSIDGDPLRGSYAKTKFEFSNTDAIEILAVNASVSDSKLHNPNATQQ